MESKIEFMEQLNRSLNGKLPADKIRENLNYYEDYINMEIRSGRAEWEVVSSLGDPRLLVRSIVDSENAAAGGNYENATYSSYNGSEYENDENNKSYDSKSGFFGSFGKDRAVNDKDEMISRTGYKLVTEFLKLPKWAKTAIVATVGVTGIVLVAKLVSFVAPVLIPVLAIGIVIKLIKDNKK